MQQQQAFTFNPNSFLDWFENAGGWVDRDLLGLVSFPGMGYGAVALQDIPADKPLFHIPNNLVLSPETSTLHRHLSSSEWDTLDHGWCRLITAMMYETARGKNSPWYAYLINMPVEFDTPMFWSQAEKDELAGTDLKNRIGKDEVESEYHMYIKPVVEAHSELFSPSSEHASLAAFHIHGSRILSRSFTVPASHFSSSQGLEASDTSDSDSEMDEPTVAVLIPLADMLNAAFDGDNANLHAGEEDQPSLSSKGGFTMESTKKIPKASQIYNTYASPPNSELLRKYGHVDILPLPSDQLGKLEASEIGGWPYGNPGDEVLISGASVLDAVGSRSAAESIGAWKESVQTRVEWWLDEGQDDTFVLSLGSTIEDEMISFIRLLLYDHDWVRAKKKNKVPSAILDDAVALILQDILDHRRSQYRKSLQDNLDVIATIASKSKHIPPAEQQIARNVSASDESLSTQDLRAVYTAVVALGEQRIISAAARQIVREVQPKSNVKKRKADLLVSR